eukprot:2445555-Pyramimonas_sp.AAC.1
MAPWSCRRRRAAAASAAASSSPRASAGAGATAKPTLPPPRAPPRGEAAVLHHRLEGELSTGAGIGRAGRSNARALA